MASISYSDFGKDSSDLLTKGFPTSGFKVLTSSKTPNGITVKTTGSQSNKGVSFTVEPEWKWAQRNATLKAKFVTDRSLEGSVSVSDVGSKGVKVELVGKQDQLEKRSASSSISFVNENVNVKGSVNIPLPVGSKDAPTLSLDSVLRYPQNLYWGANAKYSWGASLFDWNARIQLVDGDHTLGLLLDNNKDSSDITFSWFQRVSESVKYGLAFSAATKPAVAPSCSVAGEYKLDYATVVKGRFSVVRPEDSEPNLRLGLGMGPIQGRCGKETDQGVAINQQLSTHATAVVGLDVNASHLLGTKGGADHSLGFELKLQ